VLCSFLLIQREQCKSEALKQFKADCKFLVAPEWLDACRDEQVRVPELLREPGYRRSSSFADDKEADENVQPVPMTQDVRANDGPVGWKDAGGDAGNRSLRCASAEDDFEDP
jgi:hypothetical protein